MATKEQDLALRVQALQFATGHGLPPDNTLAAARKYLAFLDGNEAKPATGEWLLAKADEALVAQRYRATKAPAKKATPKVKARR